MYYLAIGYALYILSRFGRLLFTLLIDSWQVVLASCVQQQDSFQVLLESLATDLPRHYFEALKH